MTDDGEFALRESVGMLAVVFVDRRQVIQHTVRLIDGVFEMVQDSGHLPFGNPERQDAVVRGLFCYESISEIPAKVILDCLGGCGRLVLNV